MVGLSNVENTSDLAKPISTATQEALDTKVSTATFLETVVTKANVADVALKAPIDSPTFTGTVSGITKAMVELSNVENTADLAKPISAATQVALDTKVSSATFSTTVATKENSANKSTATDLGGLNPSDVFFPTQKAVKDYITANAASGNVADGGITTIKLADDAVTNDKVAIGINKSKVGLSNVENTADLDKPISTATQLALDSKVATSTYSTSIALKAPLESPTFTGTVSGITKAMVGLTDVDNTSDLGKPISTATQTALNLKVSTSTFSSTLAIKEDISNKSIATDLGGSNPSDDLYPSQKAVKTYVTANLSNGIADGSVTTVKLADESVTGTKLASKVVGYKNFVDGAGKIITANNMTVDLTIQTGTSISGGTSVWQSFTPSSSGKLSLVEFETVNPTNAFGMMPPTAYVEIYNGQGMGGTLLGRSSDITISMMGRSWKAFDFSGTTIDLISGSIYTAKLIASTSNQDWVYGNDNLYNFGISNVSSNWDHNLKTSLKLFTNDTFLTESAGQNLYGNLVSNATHTGDVTGAISLTITDGVVTTSKIANNAVDLTTKVTGNLPTGNIADGAITTAKIANNAVDLITKVTGFLPVGNISDASLTAEKIADGTLTSSKIATGAVNLTSQVNSVLPTANGGTGTITSTANTIFASPNGSAGSPSFRTLVSADIPTNLSGYIQNSPSLTQVGSIKIDGLINAGSIQNTPIGNISPTIASFTTVTTSGNTSIGGTLTVTGTTSFTTAPIFSSLSASKALFTNGNKEIVSNNITGSGNVVMSVSPVLTGTVSVSTISSTQDLQVNGISIGVGAGNKNTNTAIGSNALLSNSTGEGNTAIGYQTLIFNTLGAHNTGIGYRTLTNNIGGGNNIAIGNMSLFENTSGASNLALGNQSLLKNTIGSNNAGLGYLSLYRNTSGNNNIAIGDQSLTYNTTGSNNFAAGQYSLLANSSGTDNIGIGYNALFFNSTGVNNFAFGNNSLKENNTGNNNIALGYQSLKSNSNGGSDNIALGFESFRDFVAGDGNIAIGKEAGLSLLVGTNNILIGAGAQPSVNNANDEITLGNMSQYTVLRIGTNVITTTSDRRDKTDIIDIKEGINFLMQLKPVTFTWNTRDQLNVGRKSAGFIAQDLLSLQKSSSIGDNLDLVSENNPEKLEARYNNLLPVMVKAIQDQQTIIEQLKKELAELKQLIQNK
jgi:hypothetical protein